MNKIRFNCTKEEALDRLKKGNEAYRISAHNPAELSPEIRMETAKYGQKPYAVVVSCSDSRVPVEHIFSAGVGDLFVIRSAGTVVDWAALGSIEYGVQMGAPLVLVMGHRGCGAVQAALDGNATGNVAVITGTIKKAFGKERDPSVCEKLNIRNSWKTVMKSEFIRELYKRGDIRVLCALYDLESGGIEYLDQVLD